ncbi:MAG: hypothetical protein ABI472_08185 [Ginsengibacter sp.]
MYINGKRSDDAHHFEVPPGETGTVYSSANDLTRGTHLMFATKNIQALKRLFDKFLYL